MSSRRGFLFGAQGNEADPLGGGVHVYGPEGDHRLRFENLVLNGIEIQPLRVTITPDGAVYIQVNLIEIST